MIGCLLLVLSSQSGGIPDYSKGIELTPSTTILSPDDGLMIINMQSDGGYGYNDVYIYDNYGKIVLESHSDRGSSNSAYLFVKKGDVFKSTRPPEHITFYPFRS